MRAMEEQRTNADLYQLTLRLLLAFLTAHERTSGLSQKKQSFKLRLTKVFCRPHPHSREHATDFWPVTICSMLSVKLSSKARGVDQMLLVECFKDENCLNKDVLFCKGQTAPYKPDSRSKPTQATAGQQVVKIRSILKGYKKLWTLATLT